MTAAAGQAATCVALVTSAGHVWCSDALRELVLAEMWRLLDGEPGISRALDDHVQVSCRLTGSGLRFGLGLGLQ